LIRTRHFGEAGIVRVTIVLDMFGPAQRFLRNPPW
jgi:hypothetical protein